MCVVSCEDRAVYILGCYHFRIHHFAIDIGSLTTCINANHLQEPANTNNNDNQFRPLLDRKRLLQLAQPEVVGLKSKCLTPGCFDSKAAGAPCSCAGELWVIAVKKQMKDGLNKRRVGIISKELARMKSKHEGL